MAGINGFGQSQLIHQNMIKEQVAKSGQNSAAHNVAQGHTGVSKQAEKNKSSGLNEESHLSEAARKAMEQEEVKEASAEGGAEQAGKAAAKAKAKEREKTKGGEDGDLRGADERHNFAPGEQQKMADGSSVVHGDSDIPSFEISATGTKRLGQLDNKEYVQQNIVDTMPAQAKAVGSAMVKEKTDTPKKREKLADLKMGPDDFSSQVEGVITKATHQVDPRGKVGVAKIRSPKHEKPMVVEDTHSEELAKEAAAKALAGGEQEAFVA
jgi:hypothetical protein